MIMVNAKRLWCVMSLMAALLVSAGDVRAEIPIPSNWQGEIVGRVFNKVFRLPVTIEIRRPLPFERNPFHLFLGAGNPKDIGHLYLASAMRFNTSRGPATLRYLSIFLQGNQLRARLTETHGAEAAKVNGFSGPNVSAVQASPLMRDVLRNAWGPTEMFGFSRGTMLTLRFQGNRLSGIVQGAGNSYTGTSSSVVYQARMAARRVR
ncbi:MAG: hypothetical protein JRI80_03860 [Deltaproteobacteria bacterium]|nr:hypothetical protein [Deltaproteobacteria bacterium]